VEACVCGLDPACCDPTGAWDAMCVAMAVDQGCAICAL